VQGLAQILNLPSMEQILTAWRTPNSLRDSRKSPK
jgi:hypothetical protein